MRGTRVVARPWLCLVLRCACRYAASTTPSVTGVAPSRGTAGVAINVTGSNLSDAASIRFFGALATASSSANASSGGSQALGSCAVTAAASSWASCAAVPSLPAPGLYWLVATRANGEQSVDGIKASWALGAGRHTCMRHMRQACATACLCGVV
jgi:hypothetical protein